MTRLIFRRFLLIFSLISLASCQNLFDEFADYSYGKQLSGMSLYDSGLEFDSLEEIGYWIRENIDYEKSLSLSGPEETLSRGVGDCKSISVLFMNLAYFSLGIKCDIVCVDISSVSREVVEGGDANHTMVMYDGIIYEPQNGKKFHARIAYRYSFDHVFSR